MDNEMFIDPTRWEIKHRTLNEFESVELGNVSPAELTERSKLAMRLYEKHVGDPKYGMQAPEIAAWSIEKANDFFDQLEKGND